MTQSQTVWKSGISGQKSAAKRRKLCHVWAPQLGEKCQKQLKISAIVDLPRQHAATMHHGPVARGRTATGHARTDCLQCGRSSLVISDRAHDDADMQSMTAGVLMLLMLTLTLTLTMITDVCGFQSRHDAILSTAGSTAALQHMAHIGGTCGIQASRCTCV